MATIAVSVATTRFESGSVVPLRLVVLVSLRS